MEETKSTELREKQKIKKRTLIKEKTEKKEKRQESEKGESERIRNPRENLNQTKDISKSEFAYV